MSSVSKTDTQKETPIVLWDSEHDGDPGPLMTGEWCQKVGSAYAVVWDSYELTGSHCTRLLFFGEGAAEVAKKWSDLVRAIEDDEDADDEETDEPKSQAIRLDPNTDTYELLAEFAKTFA